MLTTEELKNFIEESLEGSRVVVRDLTGNGDHFEAEIYSSQFQNKSRLEAHRMVMEIVSDLLKGPLHAFTFKTYDSDPLKESK